MTDPRSPYDRSSEARASELFQQDQDAALRGDRLISAETGAEGDYHATPEDRTKAVVVLAQESPERFLELVGYLPHLIQDIFLQFFLLERTQKEIGETLGLWTWAVCDALKLGMESICAIIAFGGVDKVPENLDPVGRPDWDQLVEAYKKMLAFETKPEQRTEKKLVTPVGVGEFEIRVDDETLELHFAPSTRRGR